MKARAFYVASLLFGLGCGAANLQPTAAQPARNEPAAPSPAEPPPPPTQGPVTPDAGLPVFAGCVLHAGDAEKHTMRVKRPDGSLEAPVVTGKCWYGAECVQDHARATAGDGDVDLHCDGRACVCEYKPITPAGPLVSMRFELPEDCTSEALAKRLLRERCMAHMPVAP